MKHKKDLSRIVAIVNDETKWLILPAKYQAIRGLLDAHLKGTMDIADMMPDESTEPEQEIKYYDIIGNTAIINVEGTILPKAGMLEMMCGAFSLELFQKNLKELATNDLVKNIIIDFDTPGGVVTQVPETADLIAEVAKTKNVIAYSNGMIASAGYYLASQCSRIFISKSAEVGSIGVRVAYVDSSKHYEQEGYKVEVFDSGEFKSMGIAGKSLTDNQRKLIQDGVDKCFAEFKSYVLAKRTVGDESMQGQMFDSDEALTAGLIDGVINDLESLVAYLNS